MQQHQECKLSLATHDNDNTIGFVSQIMLKLDANTKDEICNFSSSTQQLAVDSKFSKIFFSNISISSWMASFRKLLGLQQQQQQHTYCTDWNQNIWNGSSSI